MEYHSEYVNEEWKNEIMSFATLVDIEMNKLSEVISQIEKNKYHMILLKCGIWKKKRHKSIYLQNVNRLKGIENKFMVAKREGGRIN